MIIGKATFFKYTYLQSEYFIYF